MRPTALTLLLTAILLMPLPAMAHKVTVFAWIEEGTVYTESKFSGGKRVRNGRIEVRDHDHRMVAEGATDDKGRFSFGVPESALSLEIVLTAGMGHTNHWTVTAQELGAAAPIQSDSKATGTPAAVAGGNPSAAGLDTDTIEKIVTRSLEKQLAPLKAQLAEQAWGLRDIVAGLGYILGLMGLASYMHHRKKSRPPSEAEPS